MKPKKNKYAGTMKRLRKSAALAMMCLLLTGTELRANNLNITNVSATDMGTYYNVTFLISWDNSWYANAIPNNWDAVWVFVKYKDCTTTNWLHANLDAAGNSVAGGVLTVETVTDNKGIFIRRAAAGGPGSIAPSMVTLHINTTAPIPPGPFNFQVFGIEMVKILQEDFQVGDGAASAPSTFPFNLLTITAATQAAGMAAGVLRVGSPATPSTYPMGQGAFYCMKYEISQEQYVDFLNTLTYDQQFTRTAVVPSSAATTWAMITVLGVTQSRNSICIKTSGVPSTTPAEYACNYTTLVSAISSATNEAGDGQNIACNYLSWYDLTAYLDWACLRPMSDMEFEKICRGPMARLNGEYPWGSNAAILQNGIGFTNAGYTNELSSAVGYGLCAIGNGTSQISYGPMRCGFAATNATDRISSGATYYGVLDMGGNVWERVVSAWTNGVTYTGALGDGTLDPPTGNQNVANWPTNAATSSGFRGGSWMSGGSPTFTEVRTSDRWYATTVDVTRVGVSPYTGNTMGGRGVR